MGLLSLRLAKVDDILDIIRLYKELHAASAYAGLIPFDVADASNVVLKTIEGDQNNGAVILLLEDDNPVGVLHCSAMPHLFNRSEKTAIEIAFWVTPERRSAAGLRKLLGAYRYWAKQTGCNTILTGRLRDKSVETYSIRKLL